MHRRSLLAAGLALAAPLLRAAPAAPVEQALPPVYLEGEVTVINWADPHPHLELAHRPLAALPDDLNRRRMAPQKVPADVQRLLSSVRPAVADDRLWRVQLPTLARLSLWDLPRPTIGSVVGVIGRLVAPVHGSPTVDAEILYIGDRGYPLRADPA